MDAHSWYLLGVISVSILVLITLINSRLQWHPFVALLVVAVVAAAAGGESPEKIPQTLSKGAGHILGEIGVTVALGAILGRTLSDSGTAARIASAVVGRASERALPWVIGAAAFAIGIPMFFEVGLIVLLPIIYAVAHEAEERTGRTGKSWVLLAMPAVASLSALHAMVPPHPGPLIAIEGLHANLGRTIAVGFACAVPAAVLAGPIYARWIAPRVPLIPNRDIEREFTKTAGPEERQPGKPVSWWAASMCFAIPVALMLGSTIAKALLPAHALGARVGALLGEPIIAMLCGVVFSMLALRAAQGLTAAEMRKSAGEAIKSVASILLIIGAGGAFQQVMTDSGIGAAITNAATALHTSLPLLGWSVALLLSLSTGSATVGVASASSIVAPLATGATPWQLSLLVVAIGAGSVGLNYVNHAGFWLVKESFGMNLAQAAKTHTAVQTIVSILGLIATTTLFSLV